MFKVLQSTSCDLERTFSIVKGHYDSRGDRILAGTIEKLVQKSSSDDFKVAFKKRLKDFKIELDDHDE